VESVNVSELGRVPPAANRLIIGGVAVAMLAVFGRFVLIPAFLAVFSRVRFAKPLRCHTVLNIQQATSVKSRKHRSTNSVHYN